MAALLETVLLGKVETSKAVQWLKYGQDDDDDSEALVKLHVPRQDFVPFLLNFLREQSSHALTNGPATPAKTPSSRPLRGPGFSSERRGSRAGSGGAGHRSASRVQLFSPAPSVSPVSGAEFDVPSGSQCLSGISTLSSPSFGGGWSPAVRALPPERRSAQRASLGDFMLSPSEAGSPSPVPQRRGRRRSGGSGPPQGRQPAGRGAGDVGRRGGGGGGGGAGGRSDPGLTSPPPPPQLNFNNMEDFPPVGASPVSPKQSKPSRRINPTPVSAERPLSKPKSCFTSTPFCKPTSPPAIPEGNGALPAQAFSGSLEEERELLRREKSKLAQQSSSPLPVATDPCTPTKPGGRAGSRPVCDPQLCSPDPSKVTCSSALDLLAQLYCSCISENLVPSVFLELFFVLQLLTSRAASVSEEEDEEEGKGPKEGGAVDVLEKRYFRNLHNCVYFAVRVLENQFELVSHLDRCTLRLLAENERVGCFCPSLRERLAQAQGSSSAKVSPSMPPFIQSVPFQPATDNRSNFSSDRAFHTFKKQRDIFYELLREWEDCHREQGWEFERALGFRVRGMVCQLTTAGNHAHFARLFQKQLVQMCKGPQVLGSPGDAPDPDLLGMLGADSLGRLKRLQERLIQPQGLLGPCPPPSFPGHQEFFRDFLQSASSCQLNQHLTDSLGQHLLLLDEVAILGPDGAQREGEGEGDMEQQDEKQRFSSVLLTARLLAKFLGFISFLPYRTSEPPAREIQEASLCLRSKTSPVLDVCAVLRSCVRRRRTVLTVPWVVEFLSMLDYSGPYLQCYRRALSLLLRLYRGMVLSRDGGESSPSQPRDGDVSYLNQLLILALLGWLFQIPVFPEDLFFSSDLEETEMVEKPAASQGLDCLPLVDQQLLYTCCPFLNEFRKLLAAFVAGSSSKSGGLIRKITPTSAEPRGPPGTKAQQKLQVELEQAFFHNQPPSLRRTVDFVAERVASNCVKHIKATLVSELVRSGEQALRQKLGSEDCSALKLSDSVCAQLCDRGRQALERGTRFCSEKGPEAVRVLLPEETSPSVLTTSENITVRLATEKACDWLSTNMTALIKREWKTAFDRLMKTLPTSTPGEGEGVTAGAVKPQPPAQGGDPSTLCTQDCTHNAPLPSDVIIEIKEVLSIIVGPRSEGEWRGVQPLEELVLRLGQSLSCRKFLSPVSEQMLIRCSVLLAHSLVSAELPLTPPAEGAGADDSGAGGGCPTRALLQQLVDLWGREQGPPAPLHLLFRDASLAAVLRATDTQWQNFLFLVRQLLQKELLREEEVSKLPWPTDSVDRIQEWTSALSQPLPSPARTETLCRAQSDQQGEHTDREQAVAPL
ncbi:codanin-1 isoform X2 [Conger conger]|uniref:codanin-1 isoform X2 n=1 Tax=Conger conger TaxID=82655 RepID=UPI002A5AB934|nr:codanin-1 isoform X2 [Conger conger]